MAGKQIPAAFTRLPMGADSEPLPEPGSRPLQIPLRAERFSLADPRFPEGLETCFGLCLPVQLPHPHPVHVINATGLL